MIGTIPRNEFLLVLAAGASAALLLKFLWEAFHTFIARNFKSWDRRR
jgi:hypothetical protein